MLAVRRPHGLTAVELLTVLAIVALLSGLAMPAMRDMIRNYQLNAAVADLFGAIDLARAQAIARGSRVQLVPLEAGGANWSEGWVVFADSDGDRRPGPSEEVIASHGPVAGGIVITFSFTSNKLPYYIAYNSSGRSCSDASSLTARWGTISLHHGGQIRRIRINMLGRARVCNPALDGASCSAPDRED